MEILHTNDIIDLFYIITSDSDFRHVIPRIRDKGKRAHCIGNENTNSSLQHGGWGIRPIQSSNNEDDKRFQVGGWGELSINTPVLNQNQELENLTQENTED